MRTTILLIAVFVLSGCVTWDESGTESALRGGNGRCASEVVVEWTCDEITMTSTKALSNLVYQGTDVDERIEFDGEGDTYTIPADGVETIWVKSGCNDSGDGPGYGERFDRPDLDCDPTCANTEEVVNGECVPRCFFGTVRNELGDCVPVD